MMFNSFEYLIFFPIVVLGYFVIPAKLRTSFLLVSSYYFYMCWNPGYALLMAFATVVSYFVGIWIETKPKIFKTVNSTIIVAGGIIVSLAILIYFKYGNFCIENLNRILSRIGASQIKPLDVLLPVGISFYIFQSISYMIDVYRGDIKAERNIFRYALYISFFPQLVAGPIERSKNILEQLRHIGAARRTELFNLDEIRQGLLTIGWGLFQKMVIADRIAIMVNLVYDRYDQYGFVEIVLAAILFSFQIYCDFDGYSNIARGSAQVLGIRLMRNFRQPYFAKNIKDFWNRWHISLSTWFADYLYIPLGGNRAGMARKYLNILIVFCISGLWHGANWSFLAWGFLHAVLRVIEEVFSRKAVAQKELVSKSRFGMVIRGIRIAVTFISTTVLWIFFRAGSVSTALHIFSRMVTVFQFPSFSSLGLSKEHWIILALSLLLHILLDALHEANLSVTKVIERQRCLVRWAIYLLLIWSIILFGIYGSAYDESLFIYFQF